MIALTAHGTKINYGVSRNMPAQDAHGRDCKVALVLIEHENGFKHRMVIPEDKIRFCGEAIIEAEVLEEAAKGGIQVGAKS